MLNSKNRVFNPYFLIGTCPLRKNTFKDNFRIEPTIICMEKISFSLKLSLAIFMGNRSLRLSGLLAPDRSCSDKSDKNNKAIKLNLLCFYACKLTSYM